MKKQVKDESLQGIFSEMGFHYGAERNFVC
jgi:hypothetical protein